MKTNRVFYHSSLLFLCAFFLVSLQAVADLTETEFNSQAATFKSKSGDLIKIYHPKKMPLRVSANWNDTPASYIRGAGITTDPDGAWNLHVAGWIMRHPLASGDAMDFVMCHEFGHAFAYLYWSPGRDKERIADYLAVRVCLPSIWGGGFSPARVKSTTNYTWALRESAVPGFDPTGCTTKRIEDAADGLLVALEPCGN